MTKNQTVKTILVAAIIFVAVPASIYSQQAQSSSDIKTVLNKYIEKRIGKEFPPLGTWADIHHREFNFNTINRPTFIYIGTRTCTPCTAEFPYIYTYAQSRSDMDFIYLTSDDAATITKDHPEVLQYKSNNFYAISIPDAYIKGYKISYGYPTKYLIYENNYTAYIWIGGSKRNGASVVDSIEHILTR